jgi:hypothetical protein
VKLLAKRLEQFRGHQALAQAAENHLLQGIEANVEAVIAGAAVPRGGAAEQVGADLEEAH